MAALVSTRISIQFPPEASCEDAYVTVLTSRRGRYVDLRVSRETGDLQLGAAGRKEKLPNGKARWTQFLTSGPSLPDNAEESTTVPHPTNPDWALETGHMPHPITGVDSPFEEVWYDVEVSSESPVLVLELGARSSTPHARPASVVGVGNEGNGGRAEGGKGREGWVVKIGERLVGLIKRGEVYVAVEEKKGAQGWERIRIATTEGDGLEEAKMVREAVETVKARGFKEGDEWDAEDADGVRWVVRERSGEKS